MGRSWTPEEKKAASERIKKRLASIQNKNPEQKESVSTQSKTEYTEQINLASPEEHDPMAGPQPGQVPDMQHVDVGELLQRIKELESQQWRTMAQGQPQATQMPYGISFSQNGSLVGTRDKYIIDPSRYPNPCERLTLESRLQRFAFKENYELEFNVTVSQYQTKDGVNTREPKFTLDLNRIMFDDDTGLATNQRYTVCRAIFHEDPEAALVVAHDNGVEVEAFEEKTFLDEMRYLRMRDWLMDAFYPPKPQQKTRKREMVIGNRVVEVFEINSENSESIPFDKLSRKL